MLYIYPMGKILLITSLFKEWSGGEPDSMEVLQQAGSETLFSDLEDGKSLFELYGENVKENESFFTFLRILHKRTANCSYSKN